MLGLVQAHPSLLIKVCDRAIQKRVGNAMRASYTSNSDQNGGDLEGLRQRLDAACRGNEKACTFS